MNQAQDPSGYFCGICGEPDCNGEGCGETIPEPREQEEPAPSPLLALAAVAASCAVVVGLAYWWLK
jgi:hypothetical protein